MRQILFFLTILLASCQLSSDSNTDAIKRHLTYFKDPKTGLCFAAINSTSSHSLSETTSITCVPCDSLKNVKIY